MNPHITAQQVVEAIAAFLLVALTVKYVSDKTMKEVAAKTNKRAEEDAARFYHDFCKPYFDAFPEMIKGARELLTVEIAGSLIVVRKEGRMLIRARKNGLLFSLNYCELSPVAKECPYNSFLTALRLTLMSRPVFYQKGGGFIKDLPPRIPQEAS